MWTDFSRFLQLLDFYECCTGISIGLNTSFDGTYIVKAGFIVLEKINRTSDGNGLRPF